MVSRAVGTYCHRFSCATLALLPLVSPGDCLPAQCLPELLLMAHHPSITAGVAKKQATWRTVVKRLQGTLASALKGEQG